MPILGNALDFAKYEGKQFRAHQLGAAPSSPVTGQMYYNTADNTLWWYDGSQWVSARGGAASTPPATTTSLGTVQLAGDLAGTATSPQIAAGVITDVEVAAANKNGAAGTYSMRTLAIGTAAAALPGDTPLSSIPAPIATVNLSGQRIQNLQDPIGATDAANKQYVDNFAQGLDSHPSVRVATTANIANLASAGSVIDGITLASNDRVLVKDQTTASQNGIYIWGAPGDLTLRAQDLDTWAEVPSAYVWVEQGTANADTGWVCTADRGGTLGTTAMPWTQFNGAGAIIAGAGLTKSGNTLDVGGSSTITVAADSISVPTGGITGNELAAGSVDLASGDVTGILPISKGGTGRNSGTPLLAYGAVGPPSTGTTWSIPRATHGLNAGYNNMVQVKDATTGAVELPDVVVNGSGDVTITWGASVTNASKLVMIVGA